MAWISITEDDVLTRVSGPEAQAYRTAAKASGQEDPLPEVIAAVVDEVRGYVSACRENSLGADGKIPPRLKHTALAMIRWRLINRLPIRSEALLDTRRHDNDEAIRLLQRVAECKYRVEDPDTGESTQILKPTISGRKRKFGRDNQRGI